MPEIFDVIKDVSNLSVGALAIYALMTVWRERRERQIIHDQKIAQKDMVILQKDEYLKDINTRVIDVIQENTKIQSELKSSIDNNTEVQKELKKTQETLTTKIYDVLSSR